MKFTKRVTNQEINCTEKSEYSKSCITSLSITLDLFSQITKMLQFLRNISSFLKTNLIINHTT